MRLPCTCLDGERSPSTLPPPSASTASAGARTPTTPATERPEEGFTITSHESFAELQVSAPLVRALDAQGVTTPFPIQSLVIPAASAGEDVLAKSPTGSGKTLAFLLPMLDALAEVPATPSALILAPTRELASQIQEQAAPLAKAVGLRTQVVLGGTPIDKQVRSIRGAHIVVATPGRLIDLIGRRALDISAVEILVLDEADRMLDMGFRPQTDRIVARLPKDRQTMLFSATLDGAVGDLARSYTHDPARLEAGALSEDVGEVAHTFAPVPDSGAKLDVLMEILASEDRDLALVFSRTRHGAKRLKRRLEQRGVDAAALHGDMTQPARQKALAAFGRGDVDVLVATDVAARGIDLDDVTHVIHYDAPTTREDFVHRSGRTGRAGRAGTCITMVMSSEEADVSRLAAVCGLEDEYRAAGLSMAAPRVVHTTRRRRRGGGAPPARSRPVPAAPQNRGNRVARQSAPPQG